MEEVKIVAKEKMKSFRMRAKTLQNYETYKTLRNMDDTVKQFTKKES